MKETNKKYKRLTIRILIMTVNLTIMKIKIVARIINLNRLRLGKKLAKSIKLNQ